MIQVGIINAGITGLSATIALSRAGHYVEIFERSHFANETGAAITAGPNGTRILSRWGFDFDKAGAVDCSRMTRVRADTLDVDSGEEFKHIQATYGNRWCFFHRADLRVELRRLTQAQEPKVKTHLGEAVADIDVEAGIIRLADATEIVEDLIIVADGAHSEFIAKFIGQPYPVHKSPLSLYRFLAPFEQMASYSEIGKFFKDRSHGSTTFYKVEASRPGPMLNTYAYRSGNLIYCGVMHLSKPEEKDLEGWVSSASVQDVVSVIQGFHPAVQAICHDANDVKVYTNMWRSPVETFTKGRAILIGDACHLMLLVHGQGACMALEDVMALEVLFTDVSDSQEVERTVQAYNKLRMPPVGAIQTMSKKMKPLLEKGMIDEIKTFYDGPIPSPQAKSFPKEYNDFFFAYDVAEEAKKLRSLDVSASIANGVC